MPLVRPGGATWSLTPPPSSFAADTADAAAPSFVEINTSEKGETSSQTTTQYTLAILERYLTTFDTFESSSHTAPAAAEGFKHDINGRGAVGCGCGIDADTSVFSEALERLSEHVTGDANGMAACLICLEDVKPTDPIWHCSGGTTTTPAAASLPKFSNLCGGGGGCDINGDDAIFSSSGCYALLHLPCAQAWARQQLQQQQVKQQKSHLTTSWGCPKCRQPYSTVPTRYSCFCRKVDNPNYNPWHVAHSCGEECAVENPVCGHPCMLLCHPGPHPPCPRVIQASCYCGKERTSRRCGKQEFSCQAMCGRKRTATGEEDCVGRYCEHPCPALCHPGECPPCIRLVTSSCRCGGTIASEIRCSTIAEFRCEKICQKLLPCGKHHCKQVCCDGKCGPCPFSIGIRTCPCGKTEETNIECGATVPPCGQTCDKILACGVHHCTERCHIGPCPQTCRTHVEKTCSCGRMIRTILCRETFKCERRCPEMKSCGRHPCKRRCCDGVHCPPCEEVCNKRLRCGNHRCPAPCHPGECSPCPLSVKISCACGKTSYSTPCGRESTAEPPQCQLACSVPATCRHRGTEFPPHRCHFGPCPGLLARKEKNPPCPFPCGKALNCGHKCSVPCHDPRSPIDIASFTPPPAPIAPGERDVSKRRRELLSAPPAAVPAMRAAMEFIKESASNSSACPPCGVMQQVTCLGGHTTVSLPCCRALPFSCEKSCGTLLSCENHSCSLPCHDIAVNACAQCTLPCQKQRPCKHTCPRNVDNAKCHPGECGECQVEVLLPCHCGKTSLLFPCYRTTTTSSSTQGAVTPTTNGAIKSKELCCTKQCLKQLAHCPHLCEASCHEGPCPGSVARCEAETTVRCSCKRLKRKLKCFEVANLLKKARKNSAGIGGGGHGGDYDSMTSLRLLLCDDGCAKSITTKMSVDTEKPASTSEGTTTTTSTFAPSLRLEGQKKCLLNNERAAEAARKERDREKKRLEKLKQKKIQQLIRVLLLFTMFIIIVCGSVLLRRVLSTFDEVAQEAWGGDNIL